MRILILTFLCFVPSFFAHAYTYERTPSGTSIESPVSITFSYNTIDDAVAMDIDFSDLCVSDCYGGIVLTGVEGDGFSDNFGDCELVSDGDNTNTYNFTPTVGGIEGVQFRLSAAPNCATTITEFMLEFNGGAPYFVFSILPPQIHRLWTSDNGFWGDDFSVGDAKSTLVAGVAASGAEIWPLLVFVGVGLAFVIFNMIASAIKQSVGGSRTEVVNPGGEDYIEKTVDDIAFKRQYEDRKT